MSHTVYMEKLPPKRPRLTREEQKAQTRRRLLESGAELFARLGYEGPSVEEIAEHAGYSRGAFYANFSNKEELMKALIAEGFDSDLQGIRRMASRVGSDALAEGYTELARSFYGDPSNLLWMLEFQLSAVRHAELRDAYVREHRKLREAAQELVRRHLAAAGDAPLQGAQEYADLFLALLPGLGLLKLLYGEEIDDALFGRAFRALLAGMDAERSR